MSGPQRRSLSSSSSTHRRWRHDVFLNFRGPDTRNNFVAHLYTALVQKRVKVFKDDKTLQMGRAVRLSLLKAIKESRISIVVFSSNYADSPWCLEELVKIMDCSRSLGSMVYPVFYDVEPSEVRQQSGCTREALATHGNHFKEVVWRAALTEAASISGLNVRNFANGDESECIKKIVETVLKELDGTRTAGSLFSFGGISFKGCCFTSGRLEEGDVEEHECQLQEDPQDEKTVAVDHIKKKYGFKTTNGFSPAGETTVAKMGQNKRNLNDNIKKLKTINSKVSELQENAQKYSSNAEELKRSAEKIWRSS